MNAIETNYKGYKFRSRLEAKWACVFDQLGWAWEYEPVDLDGYIPDFHINFGEEQWYVEIKPSMNTTDFDDAYAKASESRHSRYNKVGEWEARWSEPIMFLGARMLTNERTYCPCGISILGRLEDTRFGSIDCDDMQLCVCTECNRHVPTTGLGGNWFPCCKAPEGETHPNKHTGWSAPASYDYLSGVWAYAHNATKWKPSRG